MYVATAHRCSSKASGTALASRCSSSCRPASCTSSPQVSRSPPFQKTPTTLMYSKVSSPNRFRTSRTTPGHKPQAATQPKQVQAPAPTTSAKVSGTSTVATPYSTAVTDGASSTPFWAGRTRRRMVLCCRKIFTGWLSLCHSRPRGFMRSVDIGLV